MVLEGFVWMGHNWENYFMYVYIGKISVKIFSRTTKPISVKLGTNHSCMKGIEVCSKSSSNEG
jgi:hypothetical protein